MTTSGSGLRFDNPPVRAVELTIFFDGIEGLLLTSLAPLVTEIKASYPLVRERFAKSPWRLEQDGDGDAEQSDLYAEEGRLPFPWITFDDGSGHSVGFQDDRFRIRWEFEDGRSYPGFDSLSSQLSRQFDAFRRNIAEQTSQDVSVRRVQCQYDNSVGLTAPLDVAALALGRTMQDVGEVDSPLKLRGTLFQGDCDFTDDQYSTTVSFFAGRMGGGDTDIGLRSTSEATEEPPVGAVYEPLLIHSHDRLIYVFNKLITEAQKTEWGASE